MAGLRLYRNGRWVASVKLDQGTYVVGRSEDCSLVLTSESASRNHFSVGPNPKGEGFLLTDLESENGTFVDGVREYARALTKRAIILVGDEVILFEPDGQDPPKKTTEAMPYWAQKAIKTNPQLAELDGNETRHVAPAIQRRTQAERLVKLKPHLVLIDKSQRIFPLDDKVTTIGFGSTRVSLGQSKKGATTVLAEIARDKDDTYWLHAKGLFSKVTVDGQSGAKRPLRAGSTLVVGEHSFRFELGLETGA